MIGELDVSREAGSAESNVASVIRAQEGKDKNKDDSTRGNGSEKI
jgi:hypothetical protein